MAVGNDDLLTRLADDKAVEQSQIIDAGQGTPGMPGLGLFQHGDDGVRAGLAEGLEEVNLFRAQLFSYFGDLHSLKSVTIIACS